MKRVVVIGGGVAGCAAAVAAAEAGAAVTLIERDHQLGGAAARGEHRTICGLAAIDAERAELLEPDLTAAWVEVLSTGAAQRRGRVWLWPTESGALQAGLRRRLDQTGVEICTGIPVNTVQIAAGRITAIAGRACTEVVDAAGVLPRLLGLPLVPASQWAAQRSVLALPRIADGRATRVQRLTLVQRALGLSAAALEPLDDGSWQLSLDVPPGTPPAVAAQLAERAASALAGQVLTCTWQIAERDADRAAGTVSLEKLFAQRQRGLCWAAWPREEHGPTGVLWQWPERDRYGVPEAAVRLPTAPANAWLIGKSLPVASAAAAALRVIGTALAIGAAVGARAAATDRPRENKP